MKNLIVEQTPAVISANFDDVKAGLQNMMQAYAGLEVTEENIPERKKDVATLRKIRKAIEDKRKEVKKDYNKPLDVFEKRCKELVAVVDTEIKHINDSLDVYEEKRKADKRIQIMHLYASNIGEFAGIIPLDSIYDKRWENKSTSENEIASDMQQHRLNVQKDMEIIKNTCGDYADECMEVYARRLDLQDALNRFNDLKTARDRAEADLRAENFSAEEVHLKSTKTAQNTQNERDTWTFSVYTEEDANSVRAYLEMFGINYEEMQDD